ncbi:hypothetical protein BK004_01665 [bacterium CG10_46_32]|nr:MAG: hypothetical protein BK004_01665 [bacterium CG10_46_32]PIR56292.1 MAG: hypothetical protein COU73_01690 [Parcubacteria group bacterium CG10_big_fil_rev_8_21_14_0_10_46_32]
MATVTTIYEEHLTAYRAGSKARKSEILDAVCRTMGIARKAAIRRFNALLARSSAWEDRRKGKEIYGPDVTAALKDVWELAGRICAERLHGAVLTYVAQYRQAHQWKHRSAATALLCEMSLGTMKVRVGRFDNPWGRHGLGATKSSGIREIVPIRRGPWNNPAPGNGEVDTVAHYGADLRGDYCFTVQYTDVATIWTCLAAQWNKGERATVASITGMRDRLPFPLRGLDPDSGGEFINWHLLGWTQRQTPPITLTRTRPYQKNDHARIEQKNYVNVRKWVGYVAGMTIPETWRCSMSCTALWRAISTSSSPR